MVDIEEVGLWWEPTNEANRYYGTVTFDPISGNKLVIFGSYKNITSSDIDLAGKKYPNIINPLKLTEKNLIPLLHGITDLGKHCTLMGCTQVEFKATAEKGKMVYRTTFEINSIIIGFHFDNNSIRSLIIRYSLLDKWISNTVLGGIFGSTFAYFGTEKCDDEVFDISPDLKISIQRAPLINLSQNSNIIRKVSIISEVDIEIQKSGTNYLDEYLDIVPIIQNFFSLLIGQPVGILATKFSINDNRLILDNGKTVYPEIDFYQELNQPKKFEIDFTSEPLVHHIEVKDTFSILLNNYFNNHDFFKICYELFFSSFYNKDEYIHSKFLNYLHGLEALHGLYYSDKTELSMEEYNEFKNKIESLKLSDKELRLLDLEHINHVSLSKKISQIINAYSQLKKIFRNSDDIKSFVFKVVNTRNYYTHHDNKIKDMIIQEPEMHNSVMKLQLILHFYLLMLIGLRPSVLETILKRFNDYSSLFVREEIS